MRQIKTALVIGASGSVGRLVVDELTQRRVATRVLVRGASRAGFPASTDVRTGDITQPKAYDSVLGGVEAVVFTHGANAGPAEHEAVDYGAVKQVLLAASQPLRVCLMTAIGVTDLNVSYNLTSKAHDWKRRSERLLRASGFPYTIVRPAWFDMNKADEHRLVFLQGDLRSSGTPDDGVIARRQIARVLVDALFTDAAIGKTFELLAVKGQAQADTTPLFAALDADQPSSVDGVRDRASLPLASEPAAVLADLEQVRPH